MTPRKASVSSGKTLKKNMKCGLRIAVISLFGFTVSAPRVPRSAKHRPNAPSASTKEHYLRNVAIPFSGHLLSDFSNRFDAEFRKGAHLLGLLPGAVTKDEADLADIGAGAISKVGGPKIRRTFGLCPPCGGHVPQTYTYGIAISIA